MIQPHMILKNSYFLPIFFSLQGGAPEFEVAS